eukprot:scaffold469_cov391-Prasinococcus_capsulatus_cf.AAC.6
MPIQRVLVHKLLQAAAQDGPDAIGSVGGSRIDHLVCPGHALGHLSEHAAAAVTNNSAASRKQQAGYLLQEAAPAAAARPPAGHSSGAAHARTGGRANQQHSCQQGVRARLALGGSSLPAPVADTYMVGEQVAAQLLLVVARLAARLQSCQALAQQLLRLQGERCAFAGSVLGEVFQEVLQLTAAERAITVAVDLLENHTRLLAAQRQLRWPDQRLVEAVEVHLLCSAHGDAQRDRRGRSKPARCPQQQW